MSYKLYSINENMKYHRTDIYNSIENMNMLSNIIVKQKIKPQAMLHTKQYNMWFAIQRHILEKRANDVKKEKMKIVKQKSFK